MALQMRCEHGHSYIQGDISDPDRKGPACPRCREQRALLREFAVDAYWHGEDTGDYEMRDFDTKIVAVLAQIKEGELGS